MLRGTVLGVLVLCAGVGCGSKDGTVSVTGTLKFDDGTPVTGEGSLVLFHPIRNASARDMKSAKGSLQEDGSFELMTRRPGDGVGPGRYKVVLNVWADYRSKRLAVPPAYADAATTPLEADVSAKNRHFDLVVKKEL